MSLATPGAEPPVVAGNVYPKYHTRNPIARRLVAGYLAAFHELVDLSGADDVLEVGCGEGILSTALATKGCRVRGVDLSPAIIEVARANAAAGLDVRFEVASVYDMDPDADSAGLVVCCEVLEHLQEPQRALEILAKLANPYLLVSVPREPLWRVLNMMRGRYLTDLGNTPGHLQHWSQRRFPCRALEHPRPSASSPFRTHRDDSNWRRNPRPIPRGAVSISRPAMRAPGLWV